LVTTHKGDATATFHQMALLSKGKSKLSCLQMEAYGADINDRSCSLPGGKQYIIVDGYQLLLEIKNGLPYLCCRKPTEAYLSSLSHIIMTLDVDWDPKQYQISFDEIENFMIFHNWTSNMNTLISMGSTNIGQLLPIVLYLKKNSLTPWNILKLLILLVESLIHCNLTMFAVLTLLILATLPQLHQTLNCSALSLVGHLLTPLRVPLKRSLSVLAVDNRTLVRSALCWKKIVGR
jgi:hypothetical protein